MGSEQFSLQHIKVPQEFLARLPIYIYPGFDNADKGGLPQREPFERDGPDQSEDTLAIDVERARAEKEGGAEVETRISKITSSPEAMVDAEQNTKAAKVRVASLPSQSSLSESFPWATVDSTPPHPKNASQLSHSQTICAICLEDFLPASSTVRELPCGHIYHPECIDVSLTRNSSLCPLCKKSVLPPEFYPISMPDVIYQQGSMQRL
jgi:hypothetical protein